MRLRHKKIVFVGFNRASKNLFAANFEEVLLYAVLSKLALHTDILCRDLATGRDRQVIPADLPYKATMEQLVKLSARGAARFVMTGSMTELPGDDPQKPGGFQVAIRLFDSRDQQFALEKQTEFADFSIQPGFDAGRDVCTVDMTAFNDLVNWVVNHLIGVVLTSPDEVSQENLAKPLANSYDGLNFLVQAQKKDTNEEKIPFYQSALREDPSLEIAYYDLANIWRAERRYDESVLNYRKALEVSRGTPHLKALYATDAGIVCALMGKEPLALKWWQHAIELAPDYINPYFNIANVYEDQNELELSERFFRKAQSLAPDDLRTSFNLARVYSKMSAWENAIQQYNKQLLSEGDDPWCHSDIAHCYLNLGKQEAAVTHLQKVVTLDGDGEAGQFAQLILDGLVSSQSA